MTSDCEHFLYMYCIFSSLSVHLHLWPYSSVRHLHSLVCESCSDNTQINLYFNAFSYIWYTYTHMQHSQWWDIYIYIIGSCCVEPAVWTLLPQPPEYWDHRCGCTTNFLLLYVNSSFPSLPFCCSLHWAYLSRKGFWFGVALACVRWSSCRLIRMGLVPFPCTDSSNSISFRPHFRVCLGVQ